MLGSSQGQVNELRLSAQETDLRRTLLSCALSPSVQPNSQNAHFTFSFEPVKQCHTDMAKKLTAVRLKPEQLKKLEKILNEWREFSRRFCHNLATTTGKQSLGACLSNRLADELVSRIDKPSADNTQLIDFTQRKSVNDVSFGKEARILATTLPQFFSFARLLQLCVLCLGLFQDGDVWVGVFPECEKILIGCARFGGISLYGVRPGKSKTRQCTYEFDAYNSTMVENFLELGCGFVPLMSG